MNEATRRSLDLAEALANMAGGLLRVRDTGHLSQLIVNESCRMLHTPAAILQRLGPLPKSVRRVTVSEEAASEDQGLHIITSPIVGTFYRSPSPTAESFVRIGSNVEPETVVCIIEAMKLMNEIDSEYDGEVVNVYVESGQPVQYGERLFAIRTK